MKTRVERPTEFLGRLNRAVRAGLMVDCVLVCPGDDFNFSRVTGTPGQIDRSYGLAVHELRAPGGIAVPQDYNPKTRPLIHLSRGAGYKGSADENPYNPEGMGLSQVAGLTGTAIGITIADAPAAVIVHAPTGIAAAATGIWQQLPVGTVDETIRMMEQTVLALGEQFDVSDLWVILSPGARGDTFFIDDKGRNKLVDAGERFTSKGRIQPLEVPVMENGRTKTFSLDLVGLFYDLWVFAGVPEFQIHFDERNNMTERDDEGRLILPSKRRADEAGELGYSSGLLAVVVHED